MNKNLRGVMENAGITVRALATALGITEGTVQNKLSGDADWKWEEVLFIKDMFPQYRVEWLFERVEK